MDKAERLRKRLHLLQTKTVELTTAEKLWVIHIEEQLTSHE